MERGHGEPAADPVVPQRIALIGTRGVPARYGGFETCVEEVGQRLAERGPRGRRLLPHDRSDGSRADEYRGMELVHLPAAQAPQLETLSHTALSVAPPAARTAPTSRSCSTRRTRRSCPLLRAARHPGRHPRRRPRVAARQVGPASASATTGWPSRWRCAGPTRSSPTRRASPTTTGTEFGAATELIAYGAPRSRPTTAPTAGRARPRRPAATTSWWRGSSPRTTSTSSSTATSRSARHACRWSSSVGAPYADEYTRARCTPPADDRVRFLGGVWDQELLDQLYAHCSTYLHGHSVGGTNPSLLRAIGAGAATIAYDVVLQPRGARRRGADLPLARGPASSHRGGRGRSARPRAASCERERARPRLRLGPGRRGIRPPRRAVGERADQPPRTAARSPVRPVGGARRCLRTTTQLRPSTWSSPSPPSVATTS